MSNSAWESLAWAALQPVYTDVSEWPHTIVDLRYGTKNNLLREDVYGGWQRALLHKEAASMYRIAIDWLNKNYPELDFIIFDALRPRSAQKQFWNIVKNTPQQIYFADPAKGSLHNYGFAIDLSLVDKKTGKELPMGTEFDDLTDLAQPKMEAIMLSSGKLTQQELDNRLILRQAFTQAGFEQLPHEWWHFDAKPGDIVRSKYPILE